MSQFRKDPITGRWVIIASERSQRPRQLGPSNQRADAEPCPFCPGNETMTPPELWAARSAGSAADRPGWTVRVVPNKYPALAPGNGRNHVADTLYQSRAGIGAHEVIIESPNHDVSWAQLDESQCAEIGRAYLTRLRALGRDRRWRYALLYKNQGDSAGATLEHVHSQLIAMPTMPQAARQELKRAREYYQASGRCLYCAVIARELERRERVIFEHDRFIACCPFAPRFAYEAWLLPKTHMAAFIDSSEDVIESFSRALREILTRLKVALGDPPFNFYLHSLPLDHGAAPCYHWQLRILPQLARAAGFEWASGAHINPVAPEAAAATLRDALA